MRELFSLAGLVFSCLVWTSLLSSCATTDKPQSELFELSTGERWECSSFIQEECGMSLVGCGPLKAHFDCVSNVRYIGKSKE